MENLPEEQGLGGETKSVKQLQAEIDEFMARSREEMGPEPSLEEGDELLAEFLDPSEGCDEFLITVKSVIPAGDPREVIIMARARFTDTFWANTKRER